MPFTTPINQRSISVLRNPGENKRLLNSNSQALFTFGDFKIQRSKTFNYLSATTEDLSFDGFSTLSSLGAENITQTDLMYSVGESELNHNPEDPKSHVYFSSFYTNVAKSINNIIDNYPYSILSTGNGGQNIFDYAEDFNSNTGNTSSFYLKQINLINQGDIILNSGNTLNKISLVYDFDKYAIQISGETVDHKILSYKYVSSTNTLEFKIEGELLLDDSLVNQNVYIKPVVSETISFKTNLSSLENQLIGSGKLEIPSMEDDSSFLEQFKWPRTIDNIAPDSYGTQFNAYKENVLIAAEKIDEEKTNIFLKTIIPENYLEFDSSGQIFRTLVQTYAYEFDSLKKYVDGIAYAHSIDYNKEGNVPDKFLPKLSKLLGWKLASSFNEIDLFDYLTTDDTETVDSLAEFNIEVWKRILTNIVWLYKKKGTRDALSFIFKIMGAPECLINLNEFVYDIENVVSSGGGVSPLNPVLIPTNPTLLLSPNPILFTLPGITPIGIEELLNPGIAPIVNPGLINPIINPINPVINPSLGNEKIDEFGYIDYNYSKFHFQAGGEGRGTGLDYINQWRPEFNPIIRADNIKVQVGDPDLTIGTKTIINTKEVDLYYEPSMAIECSVFDFYKNLTGLCSTWLWGSPDSEAGSGSTTTYCPHLTASELYFDNLNLTYEEYGLMGSVTSFNPGAISGMTLSQYIDYIFTTSVNPRDRKTNSQTHTSWHYPELRRIYLAYYEYSNSKLTMGKLEAYLDLLGVNLREYIQQVIPATTILRGNGSILYKNPVFHRQRFIYKDGIDKGSIFQNRFPEDANPAIAIGNISIEINENPLAPIPIVNINSDVNIGNTEGSLKIMHISMDTSNNIKAQNKAYSITLEVGTIIQTNISAWDVALSVGRNASKTSSSTPIIL